MRQLVYQFESTPVAITRIREEKSFAAEIGEDEERALAAEYQEDGNKATSRIPVMV